MEINYFYATQEAYTHILKVNQHTIIRVHHFVKNNGFKLMEYL